MNGENVGRALILEGVGNGREDDAVVRDVMAMFFHNAVGNMVCIERLPCPLGKNY